MTRVKGSPPRGLSDVVKNDRMLKGRTVLNALFKVWFVLWDRDLHTEDQRHAGVSHLEKWNLNSDSNGLKSLEKKRGGGHPDLRENPQRKPVRQE